MSLYHKIYDIIFLAPCLSDNKKLYVTKKRHITSPTPSNDNTFNVTEALRVSQRLIYKCHQLMTKFVRQTLFC
jgi:hypothetical protein